MRLARRPFPHGHVEVEAAQMHLGLLLRRHLRPAGDQFRGDLIDLVRAFQGVGVEGLDGLLAGLGESEETGGGFLFGDQAALDQVRDGVVVDGLRLRGQGRQERLVGAFRRLPVQDQGAVVDAGPALALEPADGHLHLGPVQVLGQSAHGQPSVGGLQGLDGASLREAILLVADPFVGEGVARRRLLRDLHEAVPLRGTGGPQRLAAGGKTLQLRGGLGAAVGGERQQQPLLGEGEFHVHDASDGAGDHKRRGRWRAPERGGEAFR